MTNCVVGYTHVGVCGMDTCVSDRLDIYTYIDMCVVTHTIVCVFSVYIYSYKYVSVLYACNVCLMYICVV